MSDARSEPIASSSTHPDPSSSLATSSLGRPRQSHIHFPVEPNAAREPSRTTGAGLRSLPSRHLLPTPGTSPDDEFFTDRRRVRSTHAPETSQLVGSYLQSQFIAGSSQSRTSSGRAVSYTPESSDKSKRRGTTSVDSSPLARRALLSSSKNTPDQDDPNILADLRKALQYKSHVEQQLKEVKSSAEPPSSFAASRASPPKFSPRPLRPKAAPLGYSAPSTPVRADFVDFSPSVGRAPMHPVPTSTDGGATLDWSGTTLEDEKREKRWSMSLSRKSSKDKNQTLSRKGVAEKQESLYFDKLAMIKDKANPQTLHKVEITKDQLQRRYAALNAFLVPKASCLNLANVARWFVEQDDGVKSLIDEAEPLSWVRHLQNRGGDKRRRSPWVLSAMIVDEYVRSNSDAQFIHPTLQNSSTVASVSATGVQRSGYRPTSSQSANCASVERKSDDMISFDPMVHSRCSSTAGTEERASVDSQLRRWRQSLITRTNTDLSPQSSLRSHPLKESVELPSTQGWTSPVNSRSPLQNFEMKKRSRPMPQNSDDRHSSAVDSILEDHDHNDKSSKERDHEHKRNRFRLSHEISAQTSVDDMPPTPFTIADLRMDALRPTKSSQPSENEVGGPKEALDFLSSPKPQLASPIVLNSVRKPDQEKGTRLTLPPAFQTPSSEKSKPSKRSELQDHALHVEYMRKKETLDALVARNTRMKQLLQIASRSIIDYDDTHRMMSEKLGLSYSRLPPEVLEAFSHDPAAATGNMRRLRGWRAVEDFHLRRERQKEILESFVASIPDSVTPLSLPENGIYDDAIASLTELVERLHSQRSTVLSRVRQTNELILKVKKMRDELKPEFDAANKHTSANYPELVRLESLFDELVNQKDRLGKLVEASLSFMLTSVAPLMKTFGRPIWDELHDFLVIPLYRNDFSGEDQWYPVTFPKRSLQHWLRLLLLFAGAPLCLQHGVRFFVNLLTQGYLLRAPSFVPSFVIYLSFSGIMCAFAFLLLVLLFAVLCECFVILWWMTWSLCIVK